MLPDRQAHGFKISRLRLGRRYDVGREVMTRLLLVFELILTQLPVNEFPQPRSSLREVFEGLNSILYSRWKILHVAAWEAVALRHQS